MKPRHSINTFWLLALLLVSLPLVAGCWLGDESLTRDRQSGPIAGDRSPTDRSPGASPATTPAGVSTNANRLQNIDIQGTPGLLFNDTRFILVTRNDLVNQYIPVGQTLDNWEAMFVIRRFPELSSPQDAIDNVVENLIDANADQNLISVTQGSQPENELAIDFIIWTEDKSLTEFNIHVYRKIQGRMIANMYLMRGYGAEGHNGLSSTIATNRQLILDSVLSSKFPLFVQ